MELLHSQVLLLILDVVITVWEAYRPAFHLPVRSRLLTALSLPPYGPTEQELGSLREDLLSGRDNLTGLVLRCVVLEVRIQSHITHQFRHTSFLPYAQKG